MATFTINFVNNSYSSGNFCVFQQNPNSPNPGVFPLAWRVQSAGPQMRLAISWNTDLYFFWAKTGELQPGVIFNPGENAPTSMTERNEITLTKDERDYKFINQRTGYQQGSLTIISDANTAIRQASVGFGLSGAPMVAVQAQPNMNFQFTPRFEYWATFGKMRQGQVLSPSEISNPVRIEFPHGIFSMNATLNADNSWTITQGMD
jgi:hypothetical protein